MAGFFAFVLGVVIETLQFYVPVGRAFSFLDLIADVVGIGLALAVMPWIIRAWEEQNRCRK